MKVKDYTEELELREGVTAAISGREITVTGPKGSVKRQLYSPIMTIEASGNKITFIVPSYTQREKKLIGTFKAHAKNMAKGVTEGHLYRMKICTGHFPMNVTFTNGLFSVKNFIGEKVPRNIDIDKSVKVTIDGFNITLEGIDKEITGQAAADIEKLTKRPNFDKRIFQDGIYITEKDGKPIK